MGQVNQWDPPPEPLIAVWTRLSDEEFHARLTKIIRLIESVVIPAKQDRVFDIRQAAQAHPERYSPKRRQE